MIREVCSCSAEFETDEDNALVLLREWRRKHRHDMKPADLDHSPGVAQVDLAPDNIIPEMHIGFRAFPDDE